MRYETSTDACGARTTRRQLLVRFVAAGATSLAYLALPIRSVFADTKDDNAEGRPMTQDQAFMEHAFEMMRIATKAGDQPYGAVVVKDNRIVGKGPSRVITNQDPTAHAEVEAIRDAARRLGTRDLSGCIIYASSKPCRMCETASYWANLERVYFSASVTDGGPPRYSSC